MQEPHGDKGTLQGLGFAESVVNTCEQSVKFYWRMWGPLGEPVVRIVDIWADMQRGYLQWLREASAAGGGDVAQRIGREVESSAREAESSFAQMAREAESSAREAQRIAREAERDATPTEAEEEEEGPSAEISTLVRESVIRSEEGSRDEEEPQDGTTTDLEESPADAEGLPLEDYDSLTVSQVTQRLGQLSVEEIERLRDYEAEHKNRRSLMERFERRLRAGREDLRAREERVGSGEAEEGSEEEIGSIVRESVRRSAGEQE